MVDIRSRICYLIHMQGYPQLFDIRKGTQPEYGELFFKYKADEIKGHLREKYDETTNAIAKSAKKILAVFLLLMFAWLPLFSIVVGLLETFADTASDLTLAQIFDNSPILFVLLLIFLVLGIAATVIFVVTRKKHRFLIAELTNTDLVSINKSAAQQFESPDDGTAITCFYNIYGKNAQKSMRMKGTKSPIVYRKGSFVYFVLLPYLLKVPCEDCMTCEMVEDKMIFEEAAPIFDLRDPEMKQYGVVRYNQQNQTNLYRTKYYGQLLFQSGGTIWMLTVMPHQYEMMRKLFKGTI